MARNYPVGKAQQMVLDALGLYAENFTEANEVFEKHGISVSSKRVGRRSEPVVMRISSEVEAQANYGGDYDIGEEVDYIDIDLSPVAQWMNS